LGYCERDPKAVVRVAVIGCGRIGSLWDEGSNDAPLSHAGAYQQCGRARLVALCDTQSARLHEAGERRGIAHLYQDYRCLFEREALDMVSICTPPGQRLEIIDAALRAGLRVLFCEKPLAADLSVAYAIQQRVRAHGALLGVAYLRRWEPSIASLTDWVRDGGLGVLQSVLGRYDKGLLNNGSHLLELLLRMTGLPRRVQAWHSGAAAGPGGDMTPDVRLEFAGAAGGFSGYLLASDHRRFSLFELDVLGTRGRLRLYDKGRHIQVSLADQDADVRGYRALRAQAPIVADLRGMMARAIGQMLDVCQGESAMPCCSLEDAMQVMQVTQSLREACVAGQSLTMAEVG
jgi:predicted dehydrogenase